jgi:hypothetical protein
VKCEGIVSTTFYPLNYEGLFSPVDGVESLRMKFVYWVSHLAEMTGSSEGKSSLHGAGKSLVISSCKRRAL